MAAEETHFSGATLGPKSSDLPEPDDDDDEDKEVEGLEREVKEMAEKVLHYRSTVPLRAVEALQLNLAAQTPVLCGDPDLGLKGAPGGGGKRCDGERAEPSRETSISETDLEMIEKIQLFRRKTSKSIETLPAVLKRMNDCIARIDRVCLHNVNIHPVFKKQRNL